MTKAAVVEIDDIPERPRNPFQGIADRCRLSERTVRKAFSRQPVTWQTAARLSKALQIDLGHFRIKTDNRGKKKAGRE